MNVNDENRRAGTTSAGEFKSLRPLGVGIASWAPAPSPRLPAGRYQAIGFGPLAAGYIHAALPAPKTVTGKVVLVRVNTAVCVIELDAEILPDGKDAAIGRKAETRPDISGLSLVFPGFSSGKSSKTILQLDSPLVLKGTVKIQTFYGPQAAPSASNEYGRGTTKEDERTGNTTMAFHESSHRADIITYLKTKPLPRFGGQVGQTEDQFLAAQKQYSVDLQQYFDGIETYSRQNTDEVGYTRTEYEKKGPRTP